jgi:hypothetical protein
VLSLTLLLAQLLPPLPPPPPPPLPPRPPAHSPARPPPAAAQEAARAVRCDNSPANSAVGGAATGAALFALNGASAPRGALLCAAFASSLHWASDRWNLEGGVRRWLQARGLLDKQLGPGERPAGALPEGAERPEPIYMVWAQRYLPLTKMTKEEAEQHGADKQRQRELGDRAPPPES